MITEIQFANEKLKEAFEELKSGKYEEEKLYNWLERAIRDIKENPFCGIQVSKKLIPKYYIKRYNAKNLWKYNLPDAWRLIYSLEANQILILSIILEWLDHKSYERRFHY